MIFHKLKYNNSKASVLKVGNNSITTIDSLIKKIKFVGIHNANYLLSIIVPIQRRGESWVQVSNMSKMVYSSICNHELTENLVDRTITFNFCDNRIIYNKDFFKQIPLEIYAEKTMGHVFQLKKSNHYSLFEITSFTFSSYSPEPKNTYYYPFISNMNEKYMVNFYLGIVGFYGMNGFGNEIRFLAKKINNKNGKRYLSFGEKEIFQ